MGAPSARARLKKTIKRDSKMGIKILPFSGPSLVLGLMLGAILLADVTRAEQPSGALSSIKPERWLAHKVYDKPGAQYVIFGDKIFINRWWTQGVPPNRSPAWREVKASDVVPAWRPDTHFAAGDTVLYDDKIWIAPRASLGDLPSQSRAWQGANDEPTPAPARVRLPKQRKADQNEKQRVHTASDPDITLYDATASYAGGDVVDFNGTFYRARWWSLGDTPSIDYVWEELGDDPRGDKRD